MTTASSRKARGVSTRTVPFSTSRSPGEGALRHSHLYGERFRAEGARCSVAVGACGVVSTPPQPGRAAHARPRAVGCRLHPHPQGDIPAQTRPPFPGADAVSLRASLRSGQSHTRPHVARSRRLCVCAPGLDALQPSPQEQSGGPALVTS